MKPVRLILKFYAITLLVGVVGALLSYGQAGGIPIWFKIALHILLVLGLIYGHLKDSDLSYSKNDPLLIFIALSLPSVLTLVFFPKLVGLGYFQLLHLSLIAVGTMVFNYVLVLSAFKMSKGIIESAPEEDDYDS